MRKFVMTAVLLGTVAAAAPASAQYYQNRGQGYGYGQGYGQGYGYNQGQNVERQLANLQQRVDTLYQRRLLSNREASRLSREIDQIDRRYDAYRRNGLTRGELNEIQNRIQNLRAEIREERQEGRRDRYEDRYDDRYDRRY